MAKAHIRKIGLLVFVSRMITFLVFPKPVYSPDYLNGRFLNFDLFSFSGWRLRSWPTPLLYSIFSDIHFNCRNLLTDIVK
jgi:hypothetical protein